MSEQIEVASLKSEILEMVEKLDHVSFAEIHNRLGDKYPLDGDMAIWFEQANLVCWAGMSRLFWTAVRDLEMGRQVEFDTCETFISGMPLVYLTDGMQLTYPIAKRPPSSGYKNPHWWPVTIRPYRKVKVHRER